VTDLILVGGGGTCADVLAIIETLNAREPQFHCLGVLDDNPASQGARRHGLPLLGPLVAPVSYPHAAFIDCLGSPRNHGRREALLLERGFAPDGFQTLVAPSAFVAPSCRLGAGCIVYPNVVLMADVILGAHVTVLANTVMNHEVQVGDFSIVASGVNLSGGVLVGRACYLGAGSSLIQGVAVGDQALVGMGSVVIRDVAPGTVVIGNPARPLAKNDR
jgi:sugar O-acyltransferase (sialic acid O-acetyltransferase NeuD family)